MSSPRKVFYPQESNKKSPPREPPTTSENIEPPKPARSAFMCFSDAKQKETSELLGTTRKKDIIKHVAEAWRSLSNKERAYWDEEARTDKLRYVREKASYTGPWVVPKRRAKKHPLAPKRPMSAFLKYSQTRRSVVKEENPDMSNTDVSRLLGEMWRNAHPKERAPYVEQEERERAIYKNEIAKWRAEQARLDAMSRTSHLKVQQKMMEHDNTPDYEYSNSYHDVSQQENIDINIQNGHGYHNSSRDYKRSHHDNNSSSNREYSSRMHPSSVTVITPYHPSERDHHHHHNHHHSNNSHEPLPLSHATYPPVPTTHLEDENNYSASHRSTYNSDPIAYNSYPDRYL